MYIETMANGVTLVVEEMPWLPSASLELLLPLGSATDPAGQEGSAALLCDWLERGAAGRSAQEFSAAFEDLGVRQGSGIGKEQLSFSASLLAEHVPATLALYADMLRRPNLEDDNFAAARSVSQQELDSLEDNPSQRLFIALFTRYFASAHARDWRGTYSGLQALSPELVRADYQRRVVPQGMIISVAGGVRWAQLRAEVEALFADWQGSAVALPEVVVAPAQQQHVSSETSQTQIGVAYQAIAPGAPGWYENALANGVLSGGMGSRLFSEVREKRGLVYSVSAAGRVLRDFGYTIAYAGTTPERADETLEVLLQELTRLGQGVSAEELERARVGLLSSLVMQGESSGARAAALAKDVFLWGRPRAISELKTALEQCSLEQVNQFLAQRPPSRYTVLTLGPKTVEVPA